MQLKTTNTILTVFIVLAALAGVVLYPTLPDTIASHWNAVGEADGSMSKFWGVFLLPLVLVGIFILALLAQHIDPLKANIAAFRTVYGSVWIVLFVFFLYLYGLQLAWNLGARFHFTTAILPAFAALFFLLGVFLQKTKRNWFIGIRTPWTLSSDVVWERTHRLGSTLFRVVSVLMLIGLWFPRQGFWVALGGILASVLVAAVYSYLTWRKIVRT